MVNVLCISSKIYNFLEDVKQAHEPAHRLLEKFTGIIQPFGRTRGEDLRGIQLSPGKIENTHVRKSTPYAIYATSIRAARMQPEIVPGDKCYI